MREGFEQVSRESFDRLTGKGVWPHKRAMRTGPKLTKKVGQGDSDVASLIYEGMYLPLL
jgi:hypothetical protein